MIWLTLGYLARATARLPEEADWLCVACKDQGQETNVANTKGPVSDCRVFGNCGQPQSHRAAVGEMPEGQTCILTEFSGMPLTRAHGIQAVLPLPDRQVQITESVLRTNRLFTRPRP